jgi:hypothetical protein
MYLGVHRTRKAIAHRNISRRRIESMNIQRTCGVRFLLVMTVFSGLGCQSNGGAEELSANHSELTVLQCESGSSAVLWEYKKGASAWDAFESARRTGAGGGCTSDLARTTESLSAFADAEGREVRYLVQKEQLVAGLPYSAITGPKYSLPSCGRISTGAALALNSHIASCNGAFALRLNKDGSLTLYNTKVAGSNLWSTPANASVRKLEMQGDGNLILNTDKGAALDRSGGAQFMTGAFGLGSFAIVQDDGNFRVYTAAGRVRWQYGGLGN